MDKDLANEIPADEQIVIADECGDSMWDAVLAQEIKTCQVKNVSNNASALLNNIEKTHVGNTTKD